MAANDADVPAAELSALMSDIRVGLAVVVLLFYDWILCVGKEVSLVWNRHNRRTWASLVYALCRYPLLFQYALQTASISPMSTLLTANTINLLAPCMFSTMRIFALSGMNYFLAMVTFVLSILPPVLYLIQNLKWNRVENLSVPFNCSGDDFTPRRILIMCTALGRGGSIIADCLVLIITWRRTYWAHKAQRHVGIGPSLNAVMLYNGSIYFVVLASLNAIDLILVILHLSQDSFGSASSYVGLFGDALSPILISRFILSLRQVNQDATQHSNASKSMGLQFSVQTPSGHSLPRSLASLAEPVCMNPEDADMEWEHEAAVDAVTNKEDTVTSVSKADITTAMDGTPDQLNGVAAHEEVIG